MARKLIKRPGATTGHMNGSPVGRALVHDELLYVQVTAFLRIVLLCIGSCGMNDFEENLCPFLRELPEGHECVFHAHAANHRSHEIHLLWSKPDLVKVCFHGILFCRGGSRSSRRSASSRDACRLSGRHLTAVSFKFTCEAELTKLVPHHLLCDVHRKKIFAVMHRKGKPHKLRRDIRAPWPGFDDPLIALLDHLHDLLVELWINVWAFLGGACHGEKMRL